MSRPRRDDITVVFRGEGEPGSALVPALEAAQLTGADYGWICAESATVAACRRHLVKTLGMAVAALAGLV